MQTIPQPRLDCKWATPKSIRNFVAKIALPDEPDACWLWTAARSGKGYGLFGIQRRSTGAHRASYDLFVRPIPEGMMVCHRCDNPPCVNPAHLFLGDNVANMRDRASKGRGNHAAGERHGSKRRPDQVTRGHHHGRARLSEDDVRAIRRLHGAGSHSKAQLAKLYAVSWTQVDRIVTGRLWSHVE